VAEGIVLSLWSLGCCACAPGASVPLRLTDRQTAAVLAASLFVWLNAVLVRTIHHWGGVAFSFHAMHRSVLLQATVSIVWSLSAIFIMILSTKKGPGALAYGSRPFGTRVIKLFIIDLANSGTIERVVSFVGVGVVAAGRGLHIPPYRRGKKRRGTRNELIPGDVAVLGLAAGCACVLKSPRGRAILPTECPSRWEGEGPFRGDPCPWRFNQGRHAKRPSAICAVQRRGEILPSRVGQVRPIRRRSPPSSSS